jgi:chemotaxis protein MotB
VSKDAKKPEQAPEIRITKKRKAHAGHHGGAWKVAYADFVTAMMAFFLVMWITGMSKEVKASVAGYFKDPEGFTQAVKDAAAKSGGDATEKLAEIEKLEQPSEREQLGEAKKQIENIISGTPQFKDLKKHVDIKLTDEGLKIDLLEEKASLFFDAASARVKPGAASLLGQIAKELTKLPNKIVIEGHTDSRPLSRGDAYTNWELSADRANSARRVLASAGLNDGRISQVRGYAATQPRDTADPMHFSNRRVSIVVVFKNEQKELGKPPAPPGE